MRISDWSSDVCSSDLHHLDRTEAVRRHVQKSEVRWEGLAVDFDAVDPERCLATSNAWTVAAKVERGAGNRLGDRAQRITLECRLRFDLGLVEHGDRRGDIRHGCAEPGGRARAGPEFDPVFTALSRPETSHH